MIIVIFRCLGGGFNDVLSLPRTLGKWWYLGHEYIFHKWVEKNHQLVMLAPEFSCGYILGLVVYMFSVHPGNLT